jgi:hypothetical protein
MFIWIGTREEKKETVKNNERKCNFLRKIEKRKRNGCGSSVFRAGTVVDFHQLSSVGYIQPF